MKSLSPDIVTFVATGQVYDGGEEDLACAQYLEALLSNHSPEVSPYLDRVRGSHDAQILYDPSRPEFPESDIIYCTDIDRFDFAMPVTRENGAHVIRPARSS